MTRKILFPFFSGLLLAALLLPALSFDKRIIVYPQYEVKGNTALHNYNFQLLSLCLSEASGNFELQPSKVRMQQSRVLLQLKKGIDVDVLATMTSKEREETFLPVRIPVDRGITGWRIFLIKANDQPKFEKVKTLDDLKQLVAGQGSSWPDTDILIANGLPVVPSATHDGLFKMLQESRFDYFPRSILEIWEEAATYAAKGIVIEKTIALHYPSAAYFFVNKNNQKLAAQIEEGCEKAIKNGSYEWLFNKFASQLITRADLKNRNVFELKNPLLPPETPLSKKGYWFTR